ncbi:MAG: hypothetical protein AAF196_09790 [Planctomycetota bacterium]
MAHRMADEAPRAVDSGDGVPGEECERRTVRVSLRPFPRPFFILGPLAFIAGGVFLMEQGEGGRFPVALTWPVGLVGIAFFGVCLLHALWNLGARKRHLEVDDEELRFCLGPIKSGRCVWSDIESVSANRQAIYLKLSDSALRSLIADHGFRPGVGRSAPDEPEPRDRSF